MSYKQTGGGRGGASPGGYGSFGGYQDDNAGASQSDSPKKSWAPEQKAIRPVTVRQLYDALEADDRFKLDNKELNQVSLVARIENMEDTPTHHNLTVRDTSGQILVRFYHVPEDAQGGGNGFGGGGKGRHDWRSGVYVRVYGSIRSFHKNRHVVAFHIRLVSDFNEITYHALEVIQVHLFNTRGALAQTSNSNSTTIAASPGAGGGYNQAYGGHNVGGGGGFGGSGNNNRFNYGGDNATSTNSNASATGGRNEFTPAQNAVLRAVKAAGNSETGTSGDTIIRAIGTGTFSKADITNALSFLHMEGHLYTTTDDNHFKCTST